MLDAIALYAGKEAFESEFGNHYDGVLSQTDSIPEFRKHGVSDIVPRTTSVLATEQRDRKHLFTRV